MGYNVVLPTWHNRDRAVSQNTSGPDLNQMEINIAILRLLSQHLSNKINPPDDQNQDFFPGLTIYFKKNSYMEKARREILTIKMTVPWGNMTFKNFLTLSVLP